MTPRRPCLLTLSLMALSLVALVLVVDLGCADRSGPLPGDRPNVILIIIDCLRADHVPAERNGWPLTPTLDALAADGTTFTRAFSQASWTRPSLPTLLTGLYPSEHGMLGFNHGPRGTRGRSLPAAALTVAEALQMLGYETALVANQNQLSPVFDLQAGFDYHLHHSGLANRINGNFLRWLGNTRREPFFSYLHYLDLHWPYCPPPIGRDLIDVGSDSIEFCEYWRDLRVAIRSGCKTLSAGERHTMQTRYGEELFALDGRLGNLMSALRQQGLYEETLIIISSDHGEEFFEHGGFEHGQSLYDELIHIPLVVKPPRSWGAPRGQKIDSLVELRHVTRTIMEAAGAVPEAAPRSPSLLPWVDGSGGVPEPFIVAEAIDEVAVRSERYKLIYQRQEHHFRLYDLMNDPGETRDIAETEPDALALMVAHYRTWSASLEPLHAEDEPLLDKETEEGLRSLGYLN